MTGYARAQVEAVLTQRSVHATRLFRRHHADPIGIVPSPSRFCAGSKFAVLYGATDFDTAFLEVIVRDRFVREGAEIIGNTPAEAAAIMNAEEVRLTKLIRDVGIQPE